MKLVVRMIEMNKNNELSLYELLDRLEKKNVGLKIFYFAMGLLISAFAFNLFFEPYNVIPTGTSGLGLVLSTFIDIDVSIIILVINLMLLIVGLLFFGYEYALKILGVTLMYPVFLKSTTLITRLIDLENTSLFLIMVIGGSLLGLSTGLIRKSGFNPGGFVVIYDIMKKYFYLSMGNSSNILNGILITVSGFIFGMNNAIYALISLLVSSYIVDKVIIGISDNKVFYIVTNKPLEIREYIMDKLHYSVTVIDARGGYTNKKRKILMCVVPTIEYLKLKELVSMIDPKVFFLIVDAYESSVKKNCKNM